MALSFKSYIGIMQGCSKVKYVTGFGKEHNTMLWEYGKPAMAFSHNGAKDYILGLALNGYAAVIIDIPDCYVNIGNYDESLYNAKEIESND